MIARLIAGVSVSIAAAAAPFAPAETSLQPATVESAVARVHALLLLDRWPEALAEAERFHAASSGDGRLRSAWAEALFRAGRLAEAGAVLAPLAERADAPARGLLTLARLRDAEGAAEEALGLMRRAVAIAPDDRETLYWASGITATRREAIDLLERYLTASGGDDPDRIEAARGSLRILFALGDEPIWVSDRPVTRLELPLQQLWDPASGATEGYVVQARLDPRRKPVRLLLDSGSPGLLVLERVAQKHGFASLAERTAYGGGASGRQRTTRGFFRSFALGELGFRNALATVTAKELDPTGRYHGLVGLGIFHGQRVRLDLAGKRLSFEPPGGAFDGAPYWIIEGQLLVAAVERSGREGLFLLDTGHSRTLLSRRFIEGLPGALPGERVVIHAVGGRLEDARALSGVELSFQERRVGPADLRVADLSLRSRMAGVEVSGSIGLDMLDGAAIVLDTRQRRIRVSRGRPR